MLVLSAPAMLQLHAAIISATHGLMKLQGGRAEIGTCDQKTVRQAVLLAVQIACGQTVLPGDETITIDVPTQHAVGPFRVSR